MTRRQTLEPLYSLKKFPVFIGCTEQKQADDLFADMDFDICTKTGLIQLRKLLPLDLIYGQYHSEAVGGIWKKHHQEFAQFVSEFSLRKVLEIGGSNAVVAHNYLELVPEADWVIVEPSPAYSGDEKVTMIKAFFDRDFHYSKPVDGIVHSHVLEHLYDPIEALDTIYDFLEVGMKHIFSVPDLFVWLRRKFPNSLNFEHTLFLTEYFLDILLPTRGFKVLAKKKFLDHSIFFATEKTKRKTPTKIANKYKESKKLYLDFVDYHKRTVKDINKQMGKFSGEVYLFGAHIFSQSLLYFGLRQEKIKGILDDSELKQGKRLYGSSLHVMSPKIITRQEKVMVIVKAGAYTEEIKSRLRLLNPGAVII